MWIRFILCALIGSALLAGADIHGTIVIERKLTRRNVTAAAGMYQRGVAVELGADGEEDALAFERSHVAIYIEGAAAAELNPGIKASIEQRDRRFAPGPGGDPGGLRSFLPEFRSDLPQRFLAFQSQEF